MNDVMTLEWPPDIVGKIRAEYEAFQIAGRRTVEHAFALGDLLVEARLALAMRHGKWLPWLKQNFPEISERHARNFMAISRHRATIEGKSAKFADLTLSQVMDLIPKKAKMREAVLAASRKFSDKAQPEAELRKAARAKRALDKQVYDVVLNTGDVEFKELGTLIQSLDTDTDRTTAAAGEGEGERIEDKIIDVLSKSAFKSLSPADEIDRVQYQEVTDENVARYQEDKAAIIKASVLAYQQFKPETKSETVTEAELFSSADSKETPEEYERRRKETPEEREARLNLHHRFALRNAWDGVLMPLWRAAAAYPEARRALLDQIAHDCKVTISAPETTAKQH